MFVLMVRILPVLIYETIKHNFIHVI